MVFLVPFDGPYLAEAALKRAAEYGDGIDEDVTALTVVPDDESYAIDVGWYERGESERFSVRHVAGKLHEGVVDIAPQAAFRYERVAEGTPAVIVERIQAIAAECRPSVVFIGTDNVGKIATLVTSVAGGLAENETDDVHVVRHYVPSSIAEVRLDEVTYPKS